MRVFVVVLSVLSVIHSIMAVSFTPRELHGKWLVIAGGSPEGKSPVLAKGLSRSDVTIVQSKNFSNLNPGYTIVVAHAFDQKSAAQQEAARLKKSGISAYAKFAGSFRSSSSAEIYWLESYGGRTFMRIPVDSSLIAQLPTPETPRIIDMGAWYEPISRNSIANFQRGQSFELYGQDTLSAVQRKIKGFVWLTSGTPHFGYVARLNGGDAEGPGCGSPTLFAELEPASDLYDYALSGALNYDPAYRKNEDVPFPALKTFLYGSSLYKSFQSEALAAADSMGEKLQTNIRMDSFKRNGHLLYVVYVTFFTGYGENECGANDLVIELRTILEERRDGFRTLLPLQKSSYRVTHITDLNDDSKIEIIDYYWQIRRFAPQLNDFVPVDSIELDFCDCGC